MTGPDNPLCVDFLRTELVERAVEAFSAGDDEAFLACVHSDVVIWADPRLAAGVVLDGRDELAAWCREARARWSDVRFGRGELKQYGRGVFVELDVITHKDGAGGAWRLPIAIFFRDGLIVEAAPQTDRETALAALQVG